MAVDGRKVVVVMPAYNAGRTIERTYREIPLDLVDEVIVTDTIPLKRKSEKIKVISVAEHFADVIDKVYNYKSISDTYIR